MKNGPKDESDMVITPMVLSSLRLPMARCKKMKTIEHKKMQVVNYIRNLFKLRPEMFRGMSWDCVLREAKLIVIRPYSREAADKVIMHYFLESGKVPPMLSTYVAVRKKWDILVGIGVEIPTTFDVAGTTPAKKLIENNLKRTSWLVNYMPLPKRIRLFIRIGFGGQIDVCQDAIEEFENGTKKRAKNSWKKSGKILDGQIHPPPFQIAARTT